MNLRSGEPFPARLASRETSVRDARDPAAHPAGPVLRGEVEATACASSDPSVAAAPADGASPGLSALLAQARAAQRQLADQPLPIANHRLPLVQKLFGG